jgi:uncharacterized coiled-coil protein SlyX
MKRNPDSRNREQKKAIKELDAQVTEIHKDLAKAHDASLAKLANKPRQA